MPMQVFSKRNEEHKFRTILRTQSCHDALPRKKRTEMEKIAEERLLLRAPAKEIRAEKYEPIHLGGDPREYGTVQWVTFLR